MLITCAFYVPGAQPASSPTVYVGTATIRLLTFSTDAANRAYVNVTQADSEPSFGIVPAKLGTTTPAAWAATAAGIMECAAWFDRILRAIGTVS